ncbi:MAG: DUF6880 family protein [Elainellaceae cyanobacterium]
MASLSNILDEDLLIDLAGDRYFERGEDYFERGLVRGMAQYDERITAEVMGTEVYQVHLWLEDYDLKSRCTCPLGADDLFCKHCVAVGLAWIAEPPAYSPEGKAPATPGITMEDVRDYLARQDRDTLVNMILERAMEDRSLREMLLVKAAVRQEGGADIQAFRRSMRQAIAINGFVDYGAAGSYADGVQTVMDGLEDLLDEGYATDVLELCEEAMELLEDALNSVDDSNGHLHEILEQVQELHHHACQQGRPNPRALAERLFRVELASGYGFFHNAIETYADILGDQGLEIYKELVDEEWDRMPELTSSSGRSFDYRRSKLNRIKETLVSMSGSLEELVEVIAKDLSQPSRYLQIAQLYQERRKPEEAIAWAEQGLKAFENSYLFWGLSNFLVGAYEEKGRFDDAVQLVWQEFKQQPSLQAYQKLQKQALKAKSWSTWRQKVFDDVHTSGESKDQARRYQRFALSGYSLLVEILLWEGDAEQAWKEAKAGGCRASLWLKLAKTREADHPEDALSIYQPTVEKLIEQTNNTAYADAVQRILKVKELMLQLDRQSEFEEWRSHIVTTYKRKRNFMKLMIDQNLA